MSETYTIKSLHTHTSPSPFSNFLSFTRLLRVIAWCRRVKFFPKPEPERYAALQERLSPDELRQAFLSATTRTQRHYFKKEIAAIQRGRALKKGNKLVPLLPFIDPHGVLRVNGRLENSHLPYDEKHPVILPGDSPLATMIIAKAHEEALHGGFQLTYAYAIRRAWILRGRVRVKAYLRTCVICVRSKAKAATQLMGNLPIERIMPSRPFAQSGVDYAGPFSIKICKGQGYKTVKGYVALFICLSSKAVHLEVVGDLTTASYLAALRRFIGRRSRPKAIWSDNATTFQGADAELRSMLREAEIDRGLIKDTLANEVVAWKPFPPKAPHFGGLWEGSIKSAKTHLKRVVGCRNLTYEELDTLIVQSEACMNSRPLTLFSGEPEDLNVLTPAHAIGGALLESLPEPIHADAHLDSLNHWRLVKAMRDHFWIRWAREYSHTLQQRTKWTRTTPNLQTDDLVLILDPSLLRLGRWPIGRVISVHPGRDGLVRVATVRKASSTYDRPITKLCRFPILYQ